MHPTTEMREKLVYMNYRRPDGTMIHRDHLLRRPLIDGLKESDFFHSGGAGCYAKPQDYAREFPSVV